MRQSRAFTLVELLVVVAIIVVLIALLVPFLGHAKDSANSAKCQSNLHQIGIALGAYGVQHGTVPTPDLWHNTTLWGSANLSWPEILVYEGDCQTFTSTSQESAWACGVFICPSHDPMYQHGAGTLPGVDPDHQKVHYDTDSFDGYGLNPQMTGLRVDGLTPSHILATDAQGGFARGSTTIGVRGNAPGDVLETGPVDDWGDVAAQGYGVYPRHMGTPIYLGQTYTVTNSSGSHTLPKRGGGSNYLMVDGHAEWSVLYGHISMAYTNPGAAASDPTKYDRPMPWNIWLNP